MPSKPMTLAQIARDIEAAYIKAARAENAAFRESFRKGAAVTFQRTRKRFFAYSPYQPAPF